MQVSSPLANVNAQQAPSGQPGGEKRLSYPDWMALNQRLGYDVRLEDQFRTPGCR
jgi:hypothetical protein